jgi:hypothetical protein
MPRTARALLAAAALACAAPAAAQVEPAPPALPPAAADSAAADTAAADPVRDFVAELADPVSAGVAVGMGVYDHLRDAPEEWGGGGGALVQRIASRAGGHVLGTSVRHGLAAALGRSTGYEPCGCAGTGARVEHVFLETFTDRDRTGRRVFSEPYLAGTLAASLLPALWHPDVSLRDGLAGSGLSVVFTLASRIVLELVPVP